MYRTKKLAKKMITNQHFVGCPCGCNDGTPQLDSRAILEICMAAYQQEANEERFAMLVRAIVLNISDNTILLTPINAKGIPAGKHIITPNDKVEELSIYSIHNHRNEEAYCAFTSEEEAKKLPYKNFLAWPLWALMQLALENKEITGLVINPGGNSFYMPSGFMADLLQSLKEKPEAKDNK